MWECVRALVACLLLLLRACAKKGAQQTGDGQVTGKLWGCCWDWDWWRRHPHDDSNSDSASRLQVALSWLWSALVQALCPLLPLFFCLLFALVSLLFLLLLLLEPVSQLVLLLLCRCCCCFLFVGEFSRLCVLLCACVCLCVCECVCCAVYPDFCGTCEALRFLCAALLVARNNNSGALCNVAAAQEVVAQVTFATVAHSGKCCCCMLQLFPQASLATHVNASSSSRAPEAAAAPDWHLFCKLSLPPHFCSMNLLLLLLLLLLLPLLLLQLASNSHSSSWSHHCRWQFAFANFERLWGFSFCGFWSPTASVRRVNQF